MVSLPTKEDFSQASGSIPFAIMERFYEAFIDSTFVQGSGTARQIILQLSPSRTEDKTEQVQNNPGSFNPFFQGSMRPTAGGKNRGVEITPREVPYMAQIRHGPKPEDDTDGIGALAEDECTTTLAIESLPDLEDSLSSTIDGQRYTKLGGPRPVGFTSKKYLIQKWKRKQETVVE